MPVSEQPLAPSSAAAARKTTPVQIILIVLGTIAFLYFARPVILPVVLACMAGMTLKPLIRWLSSFHIPPALSAAIVLCLLVAAVGIGFFQLGRPALTWMNEAPQHMTALRQRVQKNFQRLRHFNQAAAAVNNLGATEEEKREEQKKAPTVEVKDSRGTSSILDWTGTLLVGIGETLVLVYLLLASGDLFLQKLVRMMPTSSDKKRAVEIREKPQAQKSKHEPEKTLAASDFLQGVNLAEKDRADQSLAYLARAARLNQHRGATMRIGTLLTQRNWFLPLRTRSSIKVR